MPSHGTMPYLPIMQTRPIRFVHRGQVREVRDAAPTRTVLDWLREDARCTGTKEGCGEGDCGACTVIVAELVDAAPAESQSATAHAASAPTCPASGARAGGLRLRPVNSCIRFLPTLDGKALLTVEDLGGPDAPHPVQQAMIECHGSQCGFCTPGFVMTLAATYESHQQAASRPTRQQLADDLAGNLCRCTGYRPILAAGQRMFELPPRRLDTAPIEAQLRALQADPPLHYAAPNPGFGGRVDRFDAPRDAAALASMRLERPQARLLAGSTDVGLWVTKQFRDLGDILYLGEAQDLRHCAWVDTGDGSRTLRIGAAVPLEDAWSSIATRWPDLREVGLRFAGPPVRHAGTLVGNLANGSPIGDSAPVLMALDARLVLRRGPARRTVALDEFYLDYMRNRLEPGEFVEAVELPDTPPPADELRHLRAFKISKRFDCDISALCGGFALTLNGSRITDVRLAFGGMAAVVRRAVSAEAALRGAEWNETTLQRAQQALDADFTPLTDLRASADYRRQVARSLLRRLWLETRPGDALPASATSVWARDAAETGRKEALR
jgi:xanthine dehydrogenase small subunit